jgi:glycosyltransferase involved in cell wall biosynthesis
MEKKANRYGYLMKRLKHQLSTVAIFTSCDSFEGFYGGTFGIDRETYVASYRNDFVWEYAQGLSNLGHHVIIYILSYGPPEKRKIFERLDVRFLPLPWWLRLVDPVLWRLRNLKYGTTVRDRVAYAGYGSGLKAALIDDCVDVIYHQEIWTTRFDTIVKRVKVPVIGADQGAVYAEWMGPAKRRSVKLAACLICQSLTGIERARRLGANAELVYNGVDTSFFRPPTTTALRPKTVLAVGRLVEEQKRSLPDFVLTVAGSGPDENKLRKMAGDLGIEDRVKFTGFISDRAALRQLYQESGVFVSTSSWEAVALVLLEAMSCSVPVVATRIPSFLDLLTDGKDGILVSVGAPDEVASGILDAYRLQRQLGANGRVTVESRYSAEAVYERLSSIIQALR